MSRFAKLFVLFVSLIGLGTWSGDTLAAARTASVAGNWNLPATWGGAAVPTSADTCTINSGIAVTVNTAGAMCGSLTIGNATNSNTTLTLASPGTLSITTAGGQTGNLVLNPSNLVRTFTIATATGTLTVDGTFTTGTAGTNRITVSTGQVTFTRAAGLTWPALGTLTITGNNAAGSANFTGLVSQAGGTIANTTAAGTINFNGGYTKTGGTFTTLAGETINFGGNLTVSTAALTFNATSIANFTNTATITPTTAIAFGNLVINPGAGKTVTLAGNVTAAGNLSVTTGTFNLATFTAARTAAGGTLTIANGATMLVGASNYPANYTTDTLGLTSTVEYNGPAQTVTAPTGGLGYGNLTLSGSGIKTMPAAALPIQGNFTMAGAAGTSATAAGALTVGGDFVLGSSNTFNASTFSHAIAGNFTNNGATFTASTSTIALNGAVPQTIGGTSNTTFNNLTVNNGSGVSLASSPTISATLTLTAGTFAVGANTLTLNGPTIAGTPANLSTTSSSNLVFGGISAGVLVPSSVGALNNLTINNASGVTLSGSPTLNGTLTLTSGTLTVGANTLAMNGPAIAGTSTNLVTSASSSLSFGGSASSVLVPSSVGALNNLTINNASGVTLSGSPTLSGTLTLTSGTLTVGANTLTLNGPTIAGTPANLSTTAASSLSFGGTATGVNVPSSVALLNNLTVNNSNGITLNSSPALSGVLTLTSGAITTGANILGSSANCPASITRTGGFVDGNLRLTFPTGTTTCTYHVGSGGNYTPIGVTMVASAGGTLTGSTTGNEHPQISSSGIDSTLDVNRYWTLWASGDTVVATSYGATFNFVAGDVDALATTGNFVVGKYASSAWTLPTPVTATATSTGVSNVAGPINSVTDFVAGEKVFVCSVPADLPANMTCECDNYNRASVNPSTIFGGNYSLTQSSGTAGWPKIANGHLQMTDNSGNMATSATVPGTFPAAGNLISLEFRHYAYKTGGAIGADGIGVTLSDSAITPLAGAFGGSLGYAQKTGINGFAGGWIGIGIDEYGNYQSSTEGRVGGACGTAACLPESVGVRGSGSGVAGYPFLGGTATLSPVIDNTASATPAPGYAYRVQVDARCYQNNTANYTGNFAINCATANPSAAKWAKVRVYRDTTGLGNFGTPLTNLDFEAYAAAIAAIPSAIQADVPANWKLSYTGSTGGSVNFHEIGALKICAQTITPPAGYRILVDNLTPTTCPSDPQPTVTISALDTNGNPVTTYNKTVNLSATLQGGGASSATWTPYPSNLGTWDGVNKRYTFVAGDNGVAKFYLSDLIQENVYITVSEYLGTINTSLATPVQYSSGAASFVVNIPDTLGSVVVAGRAHLMSITRNKATCGGGTDTTYTGVKPLDGWYDPAVGDHPTGAAAPQICLPNAGACLPSYGTCQTLSIAAPALSSSSNNLNLTFASGVANFCLVTSDVGKYALGLRDDSVATGTPPVTGASATLTARPFAVVVSDVKQGATNNLANNTSGGSVFAKAGTAFQATVAGYLWNSAGDTGSNGLPGAAANWSAITAAGIAPSYADTVTLAAGAPFTPAAGTLSNAGVTPVTVAVASGSTTATTLSYNEVGSFTLTATPATSYLNSGINLSNRVAIFSNPASASQNGLVGRFYPDHFTLSGTLTNRGAAGCAPASSFTYLDEGLDLTFTLTAERAGGGATTNYAGAWAKFVPTVFANYAVGARSGTTNLASRISGVVIGTPAWASGVLNNVTVRTTVARAASPDGPWIGTQFGIAPIDSEGTQLLASALNLDVDNNAVNDHQAVGATTELRFGRLRMLNAYGSELLPIIVPVRAEYWNNGSWQVNLNDGCTVLTPGAIAIGDVTKPAGSSLAFSTPPTGVTGFPSATLAAGATSLKITPSVNGVGSADVILNLGGAIGMGSCVTLISPVGGATPAPILPYLAGNWCGAAYDKAPVARVKLGSSKAPYIYLRERY